MYSGSAGAWAYLADRLTNSAELAAVVGPRVFREMAPQAAPYPLTVCSWASTRGAMGVGGTHLVSEPLYLVRAIVADGDQSALAAAAAAIEVALGVDAESAPTPPVTVTFAGRAYRVQSWWEADFERAEFENGVRYDSAGGLFRLFIQATA